MSIDIGFTYFRNFRFDGKFHVRCSGADLSKVDRIHYVLERTGPGLPVSLDRASARSLARTGELVDHGCPVTLTTQAVAGSYSIRPQVVLMEEHARALGRPTGAAGVIDLDPLLLEVSEQDLQRSILDKLPLPSASSRGRRASGDGQAFELNDAYESAPFVQLEAGKRYPPLVIGFSAQGYSRLLADLQPDSNSVLVRLWPNLKAVIDPQPLLSDVEREQPKLAVLGRYCQLEQPHSMLNDTFAELIKTLAALDYVESLQFLSDARQPELLLIAAGLLATLLTGAAVLAGNRAEEDARPTPDFEARQTYLDAPNSRSQGMNIRAAWAGQVTGKGARIHFTDGGLFPDHEDLRGNPEVRIVGLEPNDNPEHGTASAGILLAVRNGVGVTGISHDSELFLYHNNHRNPQGGVQTLKDLLRLVEPGDIVGINRQAANPAVLTTFLPAVHDRTWWDVIQQLTRRGAVVVVAASNGSTQDVPEKSTQKSYGVDLGQWRYFNDLGDADAILVGACHSWDGKPHQYSNYNYRYRMLNAWGDSVTTLGYGALQDKSGNDRDYTDTYGGTSAATPLVAGALSLIQSYAMEQHHVYLNANQMHLLVMASGYREATLPDTDVLPMGRRPDVQGALALLDRMFGGGRFHQP